jgi:hypothetical protein
VYSAYSALVAMERIDDLEWRKIGIGYRSFKAVEKKLVDDAERYGGVAGMLKLVDELADEKKELNLGGIYSAYSALVAMGRIDDLEWQRINLGYRSYKDIEEKLIENPQKYEGVAGMLVLADEIAAEEKELHLGSIYSAYSTLLATGRLDDLEWHQINLRYKSFKAVEKKLVKDSGKYKGEEGMGRFSKELEVPLFGLFNAYSVLRKMSRVNDLGWHVPVDQNAVSSPSSV